MAFPLREQYVNILTDFGFKRVFGSEPNKQLLIDFLNTLLPQHHQIQTLSYKSTENLGSTPVDRCLGERSLAPCDDAGSHRKAIFDLYCQGTNGERFIVELQKAKQNFFKDRSVFYASFPIQEQALRGEWNFQLAPVYSVGILDFVFDDQQQSSDIVHTVELKNQHCEVFYDKLKFIYIELPKFTKTQDQLASKQDKWLYLFRHLPEIEGQPLPFQDSVFLQLFEVAEIANFTPSEQDSYQSSLKYYRDLNNVIETSRVEGEASGLERGRAERSVEIARSLLGKLPVKTISETTGLSVEEIENL